MWHNDTNNFRSIAAWADTNPSSSGPTNQPKGVNLVQDMKTFSRPSIPIVALIVLGLLSGAGCKDYYGEGLERAVTSYEERGPDTVSPDSLHANGISSQGVVGFTIDNVFLNRTVTSSPPWHTDGGNWTFVEAHLSDDESAKFVFGYRVPALDDVKRSMASAVIGVRSEQGGDTFLRSMSTEMGGALPPLDVADSIGSLKFDAWFKGSNYQRVGPGNYRQGGGSWNNVRLFLQHEGRVADLMMGIDFETNEGEFVEFNSQDKDALIMVLAASLRGAPFPHGGGILDAKLSNRPVSADSQFPSLKDWRVVWPREGAKPSDCAPDSTDPACRVTVGDWGFCPGTKHAFYTERLGDGRSEIRRIALSKPGFSSLIGRTHGRLWKMVCLDPGGQNYLIIDVPPDSIKNNVVTSRHPRNVWTLNAKTNEMIRLRGPWDGHRAWSESRFLSPDGEYLLLQGVHRSARTAKRAYAWYALHIASRSAIRLDLPKTLHQFRGWDGFDSTLQAMFATGGMLATTRIPYLARPSTGQTERVERLPVPLVVDKGVSPNGRWKYQLNAHGLEVVDRGTDRARIFRIPPNDKVSFRSGCCSWMGSDHLLLTSPTLGVLSLETLEYARLPDAARIKHAVEMSDEYGWMFILAGQELSLARIALPMRGGD